MGSKQQTILLTKLKELFPKVKFCEDYRPNFLKNTTGYNLEIDISFYGYKLGIEYQGSVHFQDIKRFNNDSDSSRKNDVMKQSLIMDMTAFNYCLIEFFESDLSVPDFKSIFLERLVNTRDVYHNAGLYHKSLYLEELRCKIESGIEVSKTYKPIIPTELTPDCKEGLKYYKSCFKLKNMFHDSYNNALQFSYSKGLLKEYKVILAKYDRLKQRLDGRMKVSSGDLALKYLNIN